MSCHGFCYPFHYQGMAPTSSGGRPCMSLDLEEIINKGVHIPRKGRVIRTDAPKEKR